MTKIWFIWKEICNRTFEKKQKSHLQLAIDIQRHLIFWHKEEYQVPISSANHLGRPRAIWKAPLKDQNNINIDAAWKSENEAASFSLILINNAGGFEQGRT